MTQTSRFRIKITKTGYLFIALCLAVGIAGLNTGNNLLYLIFSMMLSFIVLSGLLSNNTLQRLQISPTFPSRIFANQTVPVQLELDNRKKFFPSFSLSLSADQKAPGEKKGTFIVKVPPGQSERTTDYIRFPKRGFSQLPPYVMETTYPFGLILKYITVPSEGETLIYPELIDLDSVLASDRRLHGDFLSGQSGGSSNPYGIRDFVIGDPSRLIHWKTTARVGELKVKEFEREKRRRLLIEVVLSPKGSTEPKLQERVISLAASLLLKFAARNYELAMNLNGERIEPKGRGYMDAYLSALALAHPSNTQYLPTMTEENVVLLTDRGDLPPSKSCVLYFGPKEVANL